MADIVYLEDPVSTEDLYATLSQPVRDWFKSKFPDFTAPQKLAIPTLQSGGHLLLCSPTGSGKTLTAFLSIIDQLVRAALNGTLEERIHCIYISPIKALANDIQRNLIGPLKEIKERFLPSRAQEIRVGVRTGDTTQSERQKMLRKPPHILITTPESMAIAIASPRFRPIVANVEHMIVDELHSLVPTKRGTHLALILAQLDRLLERPVQRVGISATMEPLHTVAEFLVSSDARELEGETQKVHIAKVSVARELDLDILLPHRRFNELPVKQLLDHNVDMMKDLVEAHTTTLIFANTRAMTETIVQKLRILGVEGVEGHHGSMDKRIRLDVEQRMKAGVLRAVVSSSSLEMGIDIGSVDLVIQLGSPSNISTALQRIGRAGHHVGGIPRARFLPTSLDDLVELAALQTAIMSGDMDVLMIPRNCLDVLAQVLIGLAINEDVDIDEAYELVRSTWPYRDLEYDDYIEVLDLLEDERRIWIEWEENTFGKRGFSRMIYYTNIGTIAPDNNYLVFNQDGSVLGQLSSSFVQNLRSGDVFLLGGATYRVHSIHSSRVNVSPVTGYRPTVPSWSGEARSRSRELSEHVLTLINHGVIALRRQDDPRRVLTRAHGLSQPVAEAIAQHLENHVLESFQAPSPNRVLIEQIIGAVPTYIVTTGRGRAFNMALGYLFAGLAKRHDVEVFELSFDENGFLVKTSHEVDPGDIYTLFQQGDHRDVLETYLLDTQLFARRFREVAGRSQIIARRIGGEEKSPQQYQKECDLQFEKHRAMENSLLIKETHREILQTDLDLEALEDFLAQMLGETVRLVHTRVQMPSPLGMSLYTSAFQDLLAMRARAFFIKDIDPHILRRLLGQRSLATELDAEQLQEHYARKVPVPEDAEGLLALMERGGGLERTFSNPLYSKKLEDVPQDQIQAWLAELAADGEVTQIQGTGSEAVDGKWYSMRMADIHATLGCLEAHGAANVEDLRDLNISGLSYAMAVEFDGTDVTTWKDMTLGDPHEALRVKVIEVLGSEGPHTLERLDERLPFPKQQIENLLHELEVRNVLAVGFYSQTEDAEFILRVDEFRLTGSEDEVVEYRDLQNLVLEKSYRQYADAFEAFETHVLFQKPQELLVRVEGFRFADWKDLLIDPDITMGRLLHNRIGYTTLSQLPMLLALRPEPWLGELEHELLDRIPAGELVTRADVLRGYPKERMREIRNALTNLERTLTVTKQFDELPERKRRLTLYRRVVEQPMPFNDGLYELIRRIGPVRAHTLRLYVSRPPEELALSLRQLENEGRITKVLALQPDPTVFYCVPDEAKALRKPVREDRTLRILTQSDPYCSRFIWELRHVLKQGWYLPVLKGVDPVGKLLMFKVNDYLEVKDLQIPQAYLDEFCVAFEELLDNHRDQLIDVAVMTSFNGEPVTELDDITRTALEGIGFRRAGERLIRGGVIDPQPRQQAELALFHHHHLHHQSRWEHETLAVKHMDEVRDDFALRGRCHMFRVNLKAMAAANQLHMGINLRGHQVWAQYEHFQELLAIRDPEIPEDLLDVLEYFETHRDPQLFMDREAMRRARFRSLIQPLVRAGLLVQDYSAGFRSVIPVSVEDPRALRRDYLKRIAAEYPVLTLKQFGRLAGTPFKPEELKSVLHEMEADGELIKGFLVEDLHEICWGRKELLETAQGMAPMRDVVIPPSDPLAPYFTDLLRQRFGFGSAYLVFKDGEAVAAFKANTRDGVIDVTDYVGEESGVRVMKEFAWEHQLPVKGNIPRTKRR